MCKNRLFVDITTKGMNNTKLIIFFVLFMPFVVKYDLTKSATVVALCLFTNHYRDVICPIFTLKS